MNEAEEERAHFQQTGAVYSIHMYFSGTDFPLICHLLCRIIYSLTPSVTCALLYNRTLLKRPLVWSDTQLLSANGMNKIKSGFW